MDLFSWVIRISNQSKGVLTGFANEGKAANASSKVLAQSLDVLDKEAVGATRAITGLKEKTRQLDGMRGMVDTKEISKVKELTREVERLDGRIGQVKKNKGGMGSFGGLGGGLGGGGMLGKLSSATGQIAGAAGMPTGMLGGVGAGGVYVAAAAAATAVAADGWKRAMREEAMMGKINSTAQLSGSDLEQLRKDIRGIGMQYGTPTEALKSYEQALSLTNDKAKSMDVLKLAFQLRQAGGDMQADLSSNVSVLGFLKTQLPNVDMSELADVLMSAKRLGAGEIEGFARYLPRLAASGSSAGFNYKETAGAFSFLTSMGTPEDAATLVTNLFSKLSNSEVRAGLNKSIGLNDRQGNLKDFATLMNDLGKKMGGMSVDQRAIYMRDELKINDVQAKQAIDMLLSNLGKLGETVNGVTNSMGEVSKAAAAVKAASPNEEQIRRFQNNWDQFTTSLGRALLPLTNKVLEGANWLMNAQGGYDKGNIQSESMGRMRLQADVYQGKTTYEAERAKAADIALKSGGLGSLWSAPGAKFNMGLSKDQQERIYGKKKEPLAVGQLGASKTQQALEASGLSGSDKTGKIQTVILNWSGPAFQNNGGITIAREEDRQQVDGYVDKAIEGVLKRIRGAQMTTAVGS